MDTLYTPVFYKKYQALLEGQPTDQLSGLRQVASELLESSKDYGYRGTLYRSLAICIVPLVILTAIVYVLYGDSWLLAPAFMCLLFVFYRRSRLNNIIGSMRKPNTDMSDKQNVEATIRYLRRGLNAKHYRVDTLLLTYCIFFAWVLLLAAVWLYGFSSGTSLLIWLLVAYVVSAPLWYWFFVREKATISEIDKQAALLESLYYTLPS